MGRPGTAPLGSELLTACASAEQDGNSPGSRRSQQWNSPPRGPGLQEIQALTGGDILESFQEKIKKETRATGGQKQGLLLQTVVPPAWS